MHTTYTPTLATYCACQFNYRLVPVMCHASRNKFNSKAQLAMCQIISVVTELCGYVNQTSLI